MYRIASFGRAVAKPTPPADVETPGYFQSGTQVDFGFLNRVQEEIARAIELSGLTLDDGNDEQLYTAISTLGGRTWWRTRPWLSRETIYDTGAAADTPVSWAAGNVVKISRTTDAAVDMYVLMDIPMDGREILCTSASIAYDYDVAFDAPTNLYVEIVHRASNGVDTILSRINIATLGVTTGIESKTFLLSADGATGAFQQEMVSSVGTIFCRLRVNLGDTNSTVGALYLYRVSVASKENEV